jgi:glycine betaine/proline transport system substrate-binding protein
MGVDSDQWLLVDESLRDHIMTSMIKRMNVSVFETIKAVNDGTFQGGAVMFNLSNDGVGYATSGGFVGDIAGDLDSLKAKVVSGAISVPEVPGEPVVVLPDSYSRPQIEIECHNGDEEGNYEWLEQYFTGSWDWDESTGFGSITLDYGDGESYTSWSNEDAVENAFWHAYYSPGRFTVRATIADSSGQTATDSCGWVWSLGDDSSDPIKLPIHNWSSQIAGVYAVGAILEQAGNSVKYISAESTQVYTSMCEGDMDLVHEIWEGAFGVPFMRQVDAGCVIDAATHDAKTREDWWYPSYIEDVCPGLPDWEALNDCAWMFAIPGSGGKGHFLAGPVDWLKGDQERVEGLEMDFIVENARTAGALWAALETAYANQDPIVLFNWTPNFIEAMYDGKFIEFPAFDDRCRTVASWGVNPYRTHDCGNPKGGYVKLGVWSGFPDKWPNAYAVVQKMNFTNLDIAQLALYVDIDGMEPEDAANKWLADNSSRVNSWLAAALD